ncbi:MAG: ribonuclease HII [Gemmatimonadetes bacterium]|nr:ribonuclease HII [Gemmatimonadota bacterium]
MDDAERKRLRSISVLERSLLDRGVRHAAGVDEAGRGALAGPVIAAAVILPDDALIPGLDDSKRLTPAKRDALYDEITALATAVGVGRSAASMIDTVNIRRANLLAMKDAVEALSPVPGHLLIDGIDTIDWQGPQTAVAGGDARSLSIAAASIIAKVTRDRIMVACDPDYPEYGFARHKGYGTAAHLAALEIHGPSDVHRRSFLRKRRRIATA